MGSGELVEVLPPLILSVGMGLTIGMERSIRGRPAGLRTYLLVCVSFAVISLLSEGHFLSIGTGFRPDPARLAAGGLTGIGFLGAGVIVRSRFTVFGLTTAAGIWTVAVIGLALGSRHYSLAFALYVIALGSLWLLRYLEDMLPRESFHQIGLRMQGAGMTVEEARDFFARYHLALERIVIDKDKRADITSYTFMVHSKRRGAFMEAFNELMQREDVCYGRFVQQDQQETDRSGGVSL